MLPARVRRRRSIVPSQEARAFGLVVALVLAIVGGTITLIAITTRPDLAELSPKTSTLDDHLVLSWRELERDAPAGQVRSRRLAGQSVQLLGYMMEETGTQRRGERVRSFVMLPDPGNIFHPAHRFGDEMVAVVLEKDDSVALRPKTLMWASGRLQVLSGDPAGFQPLYQLREAHVRTASDSDIKTYFK